MADNRPSVYFEGKSLVIRASALGRCLGELVRVGCGMSPAAPPDVMEKRWAEGTAAEPWIVNWVRENGWDVFNDGDGDQVALEMQFGPVVLRCHPDGIALPQKRDGDGFVLPGRVLEVKHLRPSMWGTAIYDWQISVEMAASRMGCLKVYAEKGEDGKPTGRVDTYEIDTPPYSQLDIKRRCLEIYKAVVAAELPECDVKQYPCGFFREEDTLCGSKGKKDAAHEAEVLPVPESVVRAYLVAKMVKEDAEKDFAEAQGHLKKILADRPGTRYGVANGTLVMVKSPGRKSVDWKQMEKDGIDVEKYRSAGKEFWTITEPKRAD